MKKLVLLLFAMCFCFNYQAYAISGGKLDDGYTYKEINGVVTIYDETGKKVQKVDTVRGIIYDENDKKIGTINQENGSVDTEINVSGYSTDGSYHTGKLKVNSNGDNKQILEFSDIDNSNASIKIETFGDENGEAGGARAVIEGANGEKIEETIGSDGSFSISGDENGTHKEIYGNLIQRWFGYK